jgi:hypothetical protein
MGAGQSPGIGRSSPGADARVHTCRGCPSSLELRGGRDRLMLAIVVEGYWVHPMIPLSFFIVSDI